MPRPLRKLLRIVRALIRALVVAAILVLVLTYVGWIGFAVALLIVAAILLVRTRRRRIPRRSILEIDFERGVAETIPDDLLGRFTFKRTLVLRDVLDVLRAAAMDMRIVALLARVGPAGIGLAHAQEIRDAIDAFRESGKKTIACCETLGEGHSTSVEYYLACGFETICLQPAGDVGFNGLLLHQPFLRGLLDRLGIIPQLDHRERYKTAKYIFTERELTEPHRQSLQALLDSQAEQIAQGIAGGRKLDVETVRDLMNRGPFLAQEAMELKLVDRIAHRDEIEEELKKDDKGEVVSYDRYIARMPEPDRYAPRIALINGVGAVARGKNRVRRLPPGITMGSDDVAGAFKAAIESKKIRAIVFRVDSPGGSVVASETIWRHVQRARDAGKPVIVSMSNIAASGGYFVSACADRIVAMPGTITGSIGVLSGKLVTRDAWRKLGINWESVAVGENASIWSHAHEFSDAQWERLQRVLDHIYADFKKKVADGRRLSEQRVEEVAQGRIWSGTDAHRHGLVDELGGLRRAVELAKEAAKIPADDEVQLVVFPRKRRWSLLFGRSDSASALAEEAQELLDPVASVFWAMRTSSEPAMLLCMPWDYRAGLQSFAR